MAEETCFWSPSQKVVISSSIFIIFQKQHFNEYLVNASPVFMQIVYDKCKSIMRFKNVLDY